MVIFTLMTSQEFLCSKAGEVTQWNGLPFLMDRRVPLDPELANTVDFYRQIIDSQVGTK